METFSIIVPLFQSVVWPVTVLITIALLRKSLIRLFEHFSTAKQFDLTVGPLSFQTKAMREIRNSIIAEFPHEDIKRADVEALIESKVRSLHAAIEYATTKSNSRTTPRYEFREDIRIETSNGQNLDGKALDLSLSGIAFRTSHLIRRGERVKISPSGPRANLPVPVPASAMIVRVEPTGGDFYYGASIETTTGM